MNVAVTATRWRTRALASRGACDCRSAIRPLDTEHVNAAARKAPTVSVGASASVTSSRHRDVADTAIPSRANLEESAATITRLALCLSARLIAASPRSYAVSVLRRAQGRAPRCRSASLQSLRRCRPGQRELSGRSSPPARIIRTDGCSASVRGRSDTASRSNAARQVTGRPGEPSFRCPTRPPHRHAAVG